jgi:ABC-type antimicrobial peptide transport system permease subunit
VQRTSEIGIRLALGAHRGDIVRLIFREAAAVVGIGILAGAALAVVSTRAARALLYNVEPDDPAILAIGVLLVASVATAASYLPARRAANADPMAALKSQ